MNIEDNIVKKVASQGEDWKLRREVAFLYNKPQKILGAKLLELLAIQADPNYTTDPEARAEVERDTESELNKVHKILKKNFTKQGLDKMQNEMELFSTLSYLNQEELSSLVAELGTTYESFLEEYERFVKEFPEEEEEAEEETEEETGEETEKYKAEFKFTVIDLMVDRYKEGEKLSIDNLILLLRAHEKSIADRTKEWEQLIPDFIKRARNDITLLIKDKKLSISLVLLEERLSVLNFKVIDTSLVGLSERGGDFQIDEHLIRLGSHVFPPERKYAVFTHEVFHAISGQIEEASFFDPDLEELITSPEEILKVGLQFQKEKIETGYLVYFRWLNEAITSMLSDQIASQDSYKEERNLVRLLMDFGIPEESFYDAYFENYDPSIGKGEHKLSATKKLFELTNQKFGKGFLIKLDKAIRAKGVSEIITVLHKIKNRLPEDTSSFSEYID